MESYHRFVFKNSYLLHLETNLLRVNQNSKSCGPQKNKNNVLKDTKTKGDLQSHLFCCYYENINHSSFNMNDTC